MKTIFELSGKIFLSIFLFAIHTQLFYWLQPDFANGQMIAFSWQNLTEHTIQSMVFGALFGLMTVSIIATKKANSFYKIFIIAVALLDGIAVFYNNNVDLAANIKMIFASVHYSVYTIFIILVFGLIPEKEKLQKIAKRKTQELERLGNKIHNDLLSGSGEENQYPMGMISIDKNWSKSDIQFNKYNPEEKSIPKEHLQVINLLKRGFKPKDICETLGLKPYQITRIKQKYNYYLRND